MKILRILGMGVAALALIGLVVVAMARSANGPIGLLPGGALRTGPIVEDPDVDWSFAADIEEIELYSDGRSRTTWLLVLDGEAYIPCSLDFPPFKTWHDKIESNPRAMVRVDGKRYRVNLRRVTDPALHERLFTAGRAKYPSVPGGDSGSTSIWYFHLEERSADDGEHAAS